MSITYRSEQNLNMQGFSSSSTELGKWLRFTPALSTLCFLSGTVLAEPRILWLFSLISLSGANSDNHLFDWIYNSWVRPFTKTAPLPINPEPRRFAMLVAGIWSGVTGLLFLLGYMTAGYILGGLLVVAGTLVATTHFCLGSWMFRMIEGRKHEHQY